MTLIDKIQLTLLVGGVIGLMYNAVQNPKFEKISSHTYSTIPIVIVILVEIWK